MIDDDDDEKHVVIRQRVIVFLFTFCKDILSRKRKKIIIENFGFSFTTVLKNDRYVSIVYMSCQLSRFILFYKFKFKRRV